MKWKLVVIAAAVFGLGAVPSADAGGWATVQLSSTPDGARAGTPWIVNLTVLQHGRTLLAHVSPTVTIRRGAKAVVFHTRATARVGVYRARVVFPSAGTWRYEVWDGFTEYGGAQTHTFAPVKVRSRPVTAAA